MTGQVSDLKKKSIEAIAALVEDGNVKKVRAIQRAISDSIWNEEKILSRHHEMVEEDLGDPRGAVLFQENSFLKKGNDSAGILRQHSVVNKKIENCQVGIYASYTSPHGYTFLDKRLFIPNNWLTEEYTQRRKDCSIPEELTYNSMMQFFFLAKISKKWEDWSTQ